MLDELVAPFSESYSLLILDCPPGIGSLATAILRAADRVLMPVVPAPLSLRAFEAMRDHVQHRKVGALRLTPFFSMADRRRRLHRDVLAQRPATMKTAPMRVFAPRNRAAGQYRARHAELK